MKGYLEYLIKKSFINWEVNGEIKEMKELESVFGLD